MDREIFQRLLYRGESESLDFKVDQYSFTGATDEEKSELLKDILAFANSWREEEAHIIIGVQESKGLSGVLGVISHLADHELQQFVNSKTQRPVKFNYEPVEIEGKQCAVMIIPVQERPYYVLKKFGRVDAAQVYIRRGSSTVIALPDEIADMGRKAIPVPSTPAFQLIAKTQIRDHGAFGQFRMAAKLSNCGKATARNIMVFLNRADKVPTEVSRTVWEVRPHPDGRVLISSQELHPGSELQIAVWAIGKGIKDAQTGRFQFDGTDVQMRIKVSSHDQIPSVFDVKFSKQEIEGFQLKSFVPTT